ncbi:Ankyrin repeat and SOCS box protein 13 [Schistosoma japonicum]|nr:Ankyrin repeat and SOCS box protein 13 [Schistosoma japonicum]
MTSSTTIPGLAFYDALINNNIVELKRLIELHKIDLNARLSHFSLLLLLLLLLLNSFSYHIQVRKRNHTDLCPVHLVAYKGNLAMLHYLIQNGVNVHQPTCTLRRPVHYAALRQQVSCLQMLLNAGAQIDARDTFGNTPLHYAAEDGDGGLLSLLLNNAARSGKVWAVRRLLLFGANVNVKDRNDETALHFACRQGSTEITRMLIKAESRLNAQNQIGLTPLMESVSYNQREAVSLLIKQKDIDLYKRDFSTGDTALHIAVKKNYIHIVEILLRAGNWYIEYNYNNLVCPTPSSSSSSSSTNNIETNTSNSMLRTTHILNQNLLTRRYNGLLEVKSLQKWCRKVIRQHLGFRFIETLPLLPIPVSLKDFLLLRDIDWSIYLHNRNSINHHHHHYHHDSGELAIIVPP